MAFKQLPGKGKEQMTYNLIDQVIMTQDANQYNLSEWAYVKYDGVGRVIMTGVEKQVTNATYAALQSYIDNTLAGDPADFWQWEYPSTAAKSVQGYTNMTFQSDTTQIIPLVANYFDNYSFSNAPSTMGTPPRASKMTIGLLTGTKTAVLNTIYNKPANKYVPDMLWTGHYYDNLGRVIKTYAQHYLGGVLDARNYDTVTNVYNFSNQVITSTRNHYNTGSTTTAALTVANSFTYDHVGRKTQTLEQINGGSNILLTQADFNEIGQVRTKHLHSTNTGSTFMQDIPYTYNERGLLLTSGTGSSNALFQEQLQYNTGGGTQYNGNIASQSWGSAASPNTNTYTYLYDPINRLTSGTSVDNYNESGITYDLNGNIQTLNRTYGNTTLIDNLTYNYTSSSNPTNQIQSITDAATDASGKGYKAGTFSYTYDANGNMLTDASKSLTIAYNILNLPQTTTLSGGTDTYTYDANGTKLRKVSTAGSGSNTDYISGIEYDGGAITFIQTEEGRALYNGGTINYEYNLSDHLGNARLTFDTGTGTARPEQQDDYMPFGYDISRGTIGSPRNLYLYNKKELQADLGLYDYGARFYDPVIGRWAVVDAYSEHPDQIDKSPYAYVWDDPISKNDPDGNCPQCLTALAGALIGGGIELGGQLLSGKSLKEVDWADVGVEAVKGAVAGSGVGAIYVTAAEVGGVAVKASFDVTAKDGNKSVFNGKKSGGEALFDASMDVVAGKVAGSIGKKITGVLEKGLENGVKAETKAAGALTKAQNIFNKATDGGKNMFGVKSMTAATKLSVAQSTSDATRKAVVRSQMATAVSKGAIGSAVKNGAQNSVVDKVKNLFGIQ